MSLSVIVNKYHNTSTRKHTVKQVRIYILLIRHQYLQSFEWYYQKTTNLSGDYFVYLVAAILLFLPVLSINVLLTLYGVLRVSIGIHNLGNKRHALLLFSSSRSGFVILPILHTMRFSTYFHVPKKKEKKAP